LDFNIGDKISNFKIGGVKFRFIQNRGERGGGGYKTAFKPKIK
jgi:hypothetical protein